MKYGRKSPKNAKALRLADVLSGTVPTHPVAADNFTALNGGWNMLGNDQYGDCVAVTWANVRRLVTHLVGKENYPTLDQVIAFYKTQNPNFPTDDNGMDIQTALEYLVANGGPDGVKPVAFAKVDHTNADEVKAAIAIFGYVWTGVNVLQINMQQFNNGAPWDYSPTSPVDGGHSIVTGGYGPEGTGALSGDEKFITWGQETSFTDDFWTHQVEEAWVVIWPENLGTEQFQQGVDFAALASAYQAVTGSPFPVAPPAPQPAPTPAPVPTPDPTPTPQPVPTPVPDPTPTPVPPTPEPGPVDVNDVDLWNAVAVWASKRHCGKAKAVAQALKTWATAKGIG